MQREGSLWWAFALLIATGGPMPFRDDFGGQQISSEVPPELLDGYIKSFIDAATHKVSYDNHQYQSNSRRHFVQWTCLISAWQSLIKPRLEEDLKYWPSNFLVFLVWRHFQSILLDQSGPRVDSQVSLVSQSKPTSEVARISSNHFTLDRIRTSKINSMLIVWQTSSLQCPQFLTKDCLMTKWIEYTMKKLNKAVRNIISKIWLLSLCQKWSTNLKVFEEKTWWQSTLMKVGCCTGF